MASIPWDKVIEAGFTVFGTVYAAYQGAIRGHRKSENRLKGIEDGQVNLNKGQATLQVHLQRQDEHMARQDTSIEKTLKFVDDHANKFAEHIVQDATEFADVRKQISVLAKRIPRTARLKKGEEST